MESHDVLKRALEGVHAGPKEVAAELGVSLSLVYKWTQPTSGSGSGSRNPLDRVSSLVKLTRHKEILEWLCQKAGGYFVLNPKEGKSGARSSYEVVPATHLIVQQFAGLLDAVARAAEDSSISSEESAEIRQVWDRLKSYCEGFVRCCEEGDFAKIQEELKVR